MFAGVEPDYFDPVSNGILWLLFGCRRNMEFERGEEPGR